MLLQQAVEAAKDMTGRHLAPGAERVDREAEWPADNMRALLAAGLGALVVPREVGGHGHRLLAVAQVCESLGRGCPSTAISLGMHYVGSAVIAEKPTRGQRERYLEPIARGEHLTTLALSEPGTGAHLYIPESQLERRDDGFVLSGTKSFVTNGGHADSYVMSAAATDSGMGPGQFSCVVVQQGTPGLTWSGPWQGWGMRGNAARTATLEHARLDADELLGHEGDEIWYVFHVILPYFLVAMAGTYLGIADAALEEARAHLSRRTYAHTGTALSRSTVLQHRFGTLWARQQATRALVHEAARSGDAGADDALPLLLSAKAEVAEAAERITADVMTLLGGRAYAAAHPIQRLYRDVRAAHIMAPTTDLLRTWTGRMLLGVPVLGD